jgi:hypothetical protein
MMDGNSLALPVSITRTPSPCVEGFIGLLRTRFSRLVVPGTGSLDLSRLDRCH